MSETTNLKLFKHDNPETNENEFNIETALNENLDKIDEEAGKVNNKLSKLENENLNLKSENKRLKEDLKGLPTGNFSGESIDLNDSSEMRLQKIEIGGNSRQETSTQSSNLFDPKKAIIFSVTNWWQTLVPNQTNNTSVTIDENNILHGTVSTYLVVAVPFKFEQGKTIYNKTTNLGNSLIVYNENRQNICEQGVSLPNTYTPTETFEGYIGIRINTNANVDNTQVMFSYDENAEFEKFTPNSPSPNYPSEVECCGDNGNISFEMCNKNFLEFNISNNDAIKTINKDGTLTVENKSSVTNVTFKDLTGKVPAGTYTFSNSQGLDAYVMFNSSDYTHKVSVNNKYTFNYDGQSYLKILYGNQVANTTVTYKAQLEKGTQATEYEPHKSQTYIIPVQKPFRKIDIYKDTFIKKDGKWYERHLAKREILKGTENWTKSLSAQNGYYTSTFVNNIGEGLEWYSNMFKIANVNEYNSNTDNYLVYINNANKNISISLPTKIASTVEEFKAFLQEQYNTSTPVYIDYVLAELEDIECTEEQCEILDKIENEAKTYKNITHIYSTDNVSPNFEGTYNKDIETIIRNGVA